MSLRTDLLAILAILIFAAAALTACDRGNPGADNEAWVDSCSSLCERQIECGWTDDDQDVCVETCLSDIAAVAESDGSECAELEVEINSCLGALTCEDFESMEKCEDLLDQFDEDCG